MMHTCALSAKLGRDKVTIFFFLLSVLEIIFIIYLLNKIEKNQYWESWNENDIGNYRCFCKCSEYQTDLPTAETIQQIKTEKENQFDSINRSISMLEPPTPPTVQQKGPPIHLLETAYGKRHLTPREACMIESAARQHPMSPVTLYTVNGYFNYDDPYVKVLIESYNNFWISPLNLTQLFDGTPLAEWHRNNVINTSSYPIEHLSDACRIVILWKHGGIYLDTDAIVVNTLHYVRNTIGCETDDIMANGCLIFDRGHPLLNKCMTEFVAGYRGNEWSTNGPVLVTRILRQMCNVNDSFTPVMGQPELCQGVSVLPRKAFLHFFWEDLFQPKQPTQMDFSDMYTVHLWSQISKDTPATVGNGTLIEHLFKFSCPAVYHQILTSATGLF